MYWYYMVEAGFYWSLVFTLVTDVKRKVRNSINKTDTHKRSLKAIVFNKEIIGSGIFDRYSDFVTFRLNQSGFICLKEIVNTKNNQYLFWVLIFISIYEHFKAIWVNQHITEGETMIWIECYIYRSPRVELLTLTRIKQYSFRDVSLFHELCGCDISPSTSRQFQYVVCHFRSNN